MDTLMFIHLLIYPLVTGSLLATFVWAAYENWLCTTDYKSGC